MLTSGDVPEPPSFAEQYNGLISRRAGREPLPYITGTREFWNLTFEVSPDVLIPRPETEGLVEAVIEFFPERAASLRLADVCTGSGCVAIAVAVERPNATIVATDISAAALNVARRNAVRHSVADRVECVLADLVGSLTGPFELIVANPPYVPARSRTALQPEVRNFEPQVALFGGADGLDLIRRLLAESVSRLEPDGYLMFEFGDGQEMFVSELISQTDGLRMVDIRDDLQGIARIAIVRQQLKSPL